MNSVMFSVKTVVTKTVPNLFYVPLALTFLSQGVTPPEFNLNEPLTYPEFNFSDQMQRPFLVHFFHLLWNVQFFIYLTYAVVAGAIADW